MSCHFPISPRRAARAALIAVLVSAAVAVMPASAAAATRVVDDDAKGTAANCDATDTAFATIQAGVTAADSGDVVVVCPGAYAELVNVNKTLTLQGAQAAVDARDPGRTGLATTESVVTGSSGSTSFHVTADDVTIDGFTVQGNTNTSTFGTGILLDFGTAGTTLEDTIVQNNITGLFLANDSVNNVTTIQRNVFRTNNNAGPVSGSGIYTDQFIAGGALAGVTIDSNHFGGNSSGAVTLMPTVATSPASGVTVSNNTFDGNGNALVATNLLDSAFTGNAVTNGVGSSVALGEGVANVAVSENLLQGGGSTPRGLRILSLVGSGADTTGVTATCNSITGHATAGIEVGTGTYSGTLNGELNWWGSSTGPTTASNPGGTGDRLTDPDGVVDYTPFSISGQDGAPSTPGFQCDFVRPNVTLTSPTPDQTTSSPIPVTVTFSESVTGFTIDDVQTTDGSVSNFSGSGASYSFDVTPAQAGRVTVDVPAGVAKDEWGNDNNAAAQLTRTWGRAGSCANIQVGTNAANTLTGTPFGDVLRGLRGNDTLTGEAGDDCLVGGAGRDRLAGGPGLDSLSGGSGNDSLDGGADRNRYTAGSGNDRVRARNGLKETVNCGPGRDRARVDRNDKVKRCESVRRA